MSSVEVLPAVGAAAPCHHVVILLYVVPFAGSPDKALAVQLIVILDGI